MLYCQGTQLQHLPQSLPELIHYKEKKIMTIIVVKEIIANISIRNSLYKSNEKNDNLFNSLLFPYQYTNF